MQKFVPIMLISYLSLNIALFIIMLCLWSSLGGLMYSSLQKLVAYSLIYNLGWMISGTYIINYSWIIYYLTYSLTLMMVCYSFYIFNMNYLNQCFLISMNYMKLIFMMIFFINSGNTPIYSIFPKMVLVYCLILNKMFFVCFIWLLCALLVMFFYLHVIFTGLIIYSISFKYISYSLSWLFYFFGVISVFGLLIVSMMMFYF